MRTSGGGAGGGAPGTHGTLLAIDPAILKHGARMSHCAVREPTGQSPFRYEAEESPGSKGQGAR